MQCTVVSIFPTQGVFILLARVKYDECEKKYIVYVFKIYDKHVFYILSTIRRTTMTVDKTMLIPCFLCYRLDGDALRYTGFEFQHKNSFNTTVLLHICLNILVQDCIKQRRMSILYNIASCYDLRYFINSTVIYL